MVNFSFLDLAHVTQGATLSDTFEKSIKYAQQADDSGYNRYWFAEHHNMESVASAATPILIGHIAEKTKRIRVGSGGIMLPNHSPLIIAETFGTLGTLYPHRIDLGLGRAPGTDQQTAQSIRPDFFQNVQAFPENVKKLQQYFSTDNKNSTVRAIPGEGVDVPLWILGSSTDSAYLAASLGLPYAFASHFAPAQIQHAFAIYQREFQSGILQKPYQMACINVIIADTLKEAQIMATSFYQLFLGIIRNDRKSMQPPVDTMDGIWSVNEEALVRQMTSFSFIGTKETVAKDLKYIIDKLQLHEIMVSCPVFYPEEKLKSIRYTAEVMRQINQDLV